MFVRPALSESVAESLRSSSCIQGFQANSLFLSSLTGAWYVSKLPCSAFRSLTPLFGRQGEAGRRKFYAITLHPRDSSGNLSFDRCHIAYILYEKCKRKGATSHGVKRHGITKLNSHGDLKASMEIARTEAFLRLVVFDSRQVCGRHQWPPCRQRSHTRTKNDRRLRKNVRFWTRLPKPSALTINSPWA